MGILMGEGVMVEDLAGGGGQKTTVKWVGGLGALIRSWDS